MTWNPRRVATAVLLSALVGCGTPARPASSGAAASKEGCTADAECRHGRVCDRGACVGAGSLDPTATSDVARLMSAMWRSGNEAELERQLLAVEGACGRRCSPRVHATIWAYVGLVRGVLAGSESARDAFVYAFKLDPSVELDPVYASPEARALFEQASGAHDASLARVVSLNKRGQCPSFAPFEEALKRVSSPGSDAGDGGKLEQTIRGDLAAGEPRTAIGRWALEVSELGRRCQHPADPDALETLTASRAAFVEESVVSQALQSGSCATLIDVQRLRLWPYEGLFAEQVAAAKNEDAEVTRRLWIQTLARFETRCHGELDERARVRIQVQRDKLERIVGLDDGVLTQLRQRLLDAMTRGDAKAAVDYARAVSERELALDSRQADAEQRKAQAAESEARVAAAARAQADAAKVASNEPAPVDPANKALDRASKTLDTIDKGVSTARKAARTVNSVRALFGL